jgi:hypothetical protein
MPLSICNYNKANRNSSGSVVPEFENTRLDTNQYRWGLTITLTLQGSPEALRFWTEFNIKDGRSRVPLQELL